MWLKYKEKFPYHCIDIHLGMNEQIYFVIYDIEDSDIELTTSNMIKAWELRINDLETQEQKELAWIKYINEIKNWINKALGNEND